MRKPRYENRYCGNCQQTTRHEVKGQTWACERGCPVKYPVGQLPAKEQKPSIAAS